jgi:hypothetical protein
MRGAQGVSSRRKEPGRLGSRTKAVGIAHCTAIECCIPLAKLQTIECEGNGPSITALTGTADQAALQGLLRRLYTLGLLLLSVNCVECGQDMR